MTKAFDILYFDGLSTRSHVARLWLRADIWEIEIPNYEADEAPRIVRWPLADIHRNETASGTNTFRFGDFPFQAIECRDADFAKILLETYPDAPFVNRHYHWLFAQKWKGVALLLTLFLLTLGFGYFWLLPNLAESLAGKMPQSLEIKLGEQLAKGVMMDMAVDTARSAALQRFADVLNFETDYPLRFSVVHDETVNAFALPGGQIVVFDALLDKVESAEALAGLLAHEAAHVKKRHALKALARSMAGYLFISGMLGDVNGLTALALENAEQLRALRFSRTLEHEADVSALETLAANRLDQNGMVSLFQTLKTASEGADLPALQFLNTHPLTDERIEFARNAALKQAAPVRNLELEAAFVGLR